MAKTILEGLEAVASIDFSQLSKNFDALIAKRRKALEDGEKGTKGGDDAAGKGASSMSASTSVDDFLSALEAAKRRAT